MLNRIADVGLQPITAIQKPPTPCDVSIPLLMARRKREGNEWRLMTYYLTSNLIEYVDLDAFLHILAVMAKKKSSGKFHLPNLTASLAIPRIYKNRRAGRDLEVF